MSSQNFHIPVLLNEVADILFSSPSISDSALNLFDGTLGGGGYTQVFINKAIQNKQKLDLYASDLDQSAIDRVLSYIQAPDDQDITIKNANFADYITEFEDSFFDGITVDLGFSSNQLTESGRGFAYLNRDEPLDLRYDQDEGRSASELLLKLHNWQQLGKIIYEYSGEDMAMRIARKVYDLNKKTDWTVGEFVDVVISVIPIVAMKRKNQILSRVWQALRIWVNREFDSLERFLPTALDKLKSGGRLAVVSFHSLEDKIVTKYFRDRCKPTEEDRYGNKKYAFKLITAKPVVPSEQEVEENPRSRSAVMRVIEKL
jgi:16S rRNA (cytosine1402-N4)-methyltransferase